MKKVPYGITDYKELKENDYLYVDKTMYISELENAATILLYHRPEKLGKSLLISMLYYYYDINSKDDFDTLFKDTYIYNNPTPLKNNYYILKFDFSSITTVGMTLKDLQRIFTNRVLDAIENFNTSYGYDFNIEINDLTPSEILLKFLSYFRSLKLSHKLYVLVDEYDNFTSEVLKGDTSLFKSVVSSDCFVKAFYAIIKEYKGLGVVENFFAVGTCPVDLKNLSGGFNIATDISTYPRFNSMIGLTHAEVRNLINTVEEDKNKQEEMYNLILENYGGYLFSRVLKSEDRVFNTTLVMYFLKDYVELRTYPKNITTNCNKLENLIKLQNNTFYKELISEILETGEITGNLNMEFDTADDFTRSDIISLLYYFGYLTIKKDYVGSSIIFKVSNKFIKEMYNNFNTVFFQVMK